MHLAGGVVAPIKLVGAADCFCSQHLPDGAGVAGAGRRAEEGDGRRSKAKVDLTLTITPWQQRSIALVFNCNVIVKGRAYNCCRSIDAVADTCGKSQSDGFIELYLKICSGIYRDDGGRIASGKAHRVCCGC